MMKLTCLRCLGAALVASLLAGCAPAYRAYPDGCATYGYRERGALPFAFFHGCPTPWLRRYAASREKDGVKPDAADYESSRRQGAAVAR
ncbi:MAG TPA: hypothetical protein VHC19_13115 [Pirellulales bacterium]|nr:hypothetical protein [Pirellulales bacterium]